MDSFIDQLCECVNFIKCMNPNCNILVSSILPRFYDFYESNEIVLSFNESMKNCCSNIDVKFISSFKSFLNRFNFPIRCLYSKDGLHLSVEGLRKLCIFFQNAFLFL